MISKEELENLKVGDTLWYFAVSFSKGHRFTTNIYPKPLELIEISQGNPVLYKFLNHEQEEEMFWDWSLRSNSEYGGLFTSRLDCKDAYENIVKKEIDKLDKYYLRKKKNLESKLKELNKI